MFAKQFLIQEPVAKTFRFVFLPRKACCCLVAISPRLNKKNRNCTLKYFSIFMYLLEINKCDLNQLRCFFLRSF